jgi:hypothetical protein
LAKIFRCDRSARKIWPHALEQGQFLVNCKVSAPT